MSKKGFTLTEMMIVLIIISGLMFLIIPNLNTTKESVDTKTCDAYIQLANSQLQSYLFDKGVEPTSLQVLVDENYIQSTTCPNEDVLTIINGKVEREVIIP